ncbi:unnamed protein product [Polarella glacialis]|uniref:Uncharacterized protein n=1 Tax=Polarella glacialis TaxID=89957 RepID=A0A813ITW0_POLGL|nr:unnamed protein product [Polarella glacialis]
MTLSGSGTSHPTPAQPPSKKATATQSQHSASTTTHCAPEAMITLSGSGTSRPSLPQVALEEEEEVALEEEEVALEKEEEEGCPKFLKWGGRSPSSSRSPRCRSDSCWRQSPLSVQCLTPSGRTSAQFATFWRSCGQIPASAQLARI